MNHRIQPPKRATYYRWKEYQNNGFIGLEDVSRNTFRKQADLKSKIVFIIYKEI